MEYGEKEVELMLVNAFLSGNLKHRYATGEELLIAAQEYAAFEVKRRAEFMGGSPLTRR